MPITLSEITEDSHQADGRRWITEEHTNSMGDIHPIKYMAEPSSDVELVMVDRVSGINEQLLDVEIHTFLYNIENGYPVLGIGYFETTATQRFEALHDWSKQMIQAEDYQAMRHLPDTLDQVTDTQLDNLVGEAVRIKIRTWSEKITAMNLSVVGMEV